MYVCMYVIEEMTNLLRSTGEDNHFQISLQRRLSIEEEFQQAREEVNYVDMPNRLQRFRLRHTHL